MSFAKKFLAMSALIVFIFGVASSAASAAGQPSKVRMKRISDARALAYCLNQADKKAWSCRDPSPGSRVLFCANDRDSFISRYNGFCEIVVEWGVPFNVQIRHCETDLEYRVRAGLNGRVSNRIYWKNGGTTGVPLHWTCSWKDSDSPSAARSSSMLDDDPVPDDWEDEPTTSELCDGGPDDPNIGDPTTDAFEADPDSCYVDMADNVQTTEDSTYTASPNNGVHLFDGSQYITNSPDFQPEESLFSRNEAYGFLWNTTVDHALSVAESEAGSEGAVDDWSYSWYGSSYVSLYGGTDAEACVTHTWKNGSDEIDVTYCDTMYEDYGDSSLHGDSIANPGGFSVFADVDSTL